MKTLASFALIAICGCATKSEVALLEARSNRLATLVVDLAKRIEGLEKTDRPEKQPKKSPSQERLSRAEKDIKADRGRRRKDIARGKPVEKRLDRSAVDYAARKPDKKVARGKPVEKDLAGSRPSAAGSETIEQRVAALETLLRELGYLE